MMVGFGSTVIVFQRGIVFLAKILCRRHCPSLSLGSSGGLPCVARLSRQGCPSALCFFCFTAVRRIWGFLLPVGSPCGGLSFLWTLLSWILLSVDSLLVNSPSMDSP